jgi:hypothetical protein
MANTSAFPATPARIEGDFGGVAEGVQDAEQKTGFYLRVCKTTF